MVLEYSRKALVAGFIVRFPCFSRLPPGTGDHGVEVPHSRIDLVLTYHHDCEIQR